VDLFRKFACWTADACGSPGAFVLGVTVVAVWAITGPFFHWSDTWQLVINTGTTIVTFLMVFLIQNTQNRDTAALQVKLDELIYIADKANNRLLDLEELDEGELETIRARYEKRAREARAGDLNGDQED
jgi:low affinity Fe/Cu permease